MLPWVVAVKHMRTQHCKSGPERKARATSWWIAWTELFSCPKLFKRDFKLNPSYVLSQYRGVNFTLRECILAHIVVLLWKVHFRLILQYSTSLFLSPLPILRPTKGNLVYISQHKICFHLWHTGNNPSMQRAVTSSATLLASQADPSRSAAASAQLKPDQPHLSW